MKHARCVPPSLSFVRVCCSGCDNGKMRYGAESATEGAAMAIAAMLFGAKTAEAGAMQLWSREYLFFFNIKIA